MKSLNKIFILTAIFTALFAVKAFAAPDFTVNDLRFNITPIIHNSAAFIPLEESLRAGNISLTFPDANTAIATQLDYNIYIRFTMEGGSPVVNGRRVSGSLLSVSGRLYVPVRTLAESLGARVVEESASKVAVWYDM